MKKYLRFWKFTKTDQIKEKLIYIIQVFEIQKTLKGLLTSEKKKMRSWLKGLYKIGIVGIGWKKLEKVTPDSFSYR